MNKYSILTSGPETVSGAESTGRKNTAEKRMSDHDLGAE